MSKWCAGLLLLLSLGATATEVFAPTDIPLLDNRFRIDYGVKEITFIIKRKAGTPSVILVRPDGSKLYVGRVKPVDVGWLALPEHDLITLRNPMPGPWQAIGEVDPDNRVRILSDIRLDIAALPMQLYQGEVVKLKAWLLINGQPPKDKYYLSDLGMTVKLQSFSDAAQQQVVLDQVLGHYRDDGKGLDEVPGDGIMTAEVTLQDIPGGKYRAMFSTGNQVFVRARYQDVLLYPYPFGYNLAPPSAELGAKLSLLIDSDELDPASVVIKGSVTSNVGGLYAFSETTSGPKLDIDLSAIKEVGQHEVKATLYGTNRLGRELKIELPVKTFNVFPPPPPPVEVVSAAAVASSAESVEGAPEEGMGWVFWALVGGGVLLVLLGGAGFVVLQKRRAFKRALAAAQAENQQSGQPAAKLDLNLPEQ
ncbi:TIGR03503 family protein [Aeromonas fluvialis]|uniref:TIGR03503 family protein n=1 Tax=Aeromonas fluvialis TaxID=591962 RepID=UPI0005A8DD08|nr:TIGR03503 family protein [Aeromonas fluvialis]